MFSRRDYCKKLSHYRKRAWTCRLTRKAGLTYEEALACEAEANGELQQVQDDASKLRISPMTAALTNWTTPTFCNLAFVSCPISGLASVHCSHLPLRPVYIPRSYMFSIEVLYCFCFCMACMQTANCPCRSLWQSQPCQGCPKSWKSANIIIVDPLSTCLRCALA